MNKVFKVYIHEVDNIMEIFWPNTLALIPVVRQCYKKLFSHFPGKTSPPYLVS